MQNIEQFVKEGQEIKPLQTCESYFLTFQKKCGVSVIGFALQNIVQVDTRFYLDTDDLQRMKQKVKSSPRQYALSNLECSYTDSPGQDASPSQVPSQQCWYSFAAEYTEASWGKFNCLSFKSEPCPVSARTHDPSPTP